MNVKNYIFDDELIELVKDYITLFDPICQLINFAQSSTASLAQAVSMWINLNPTIKFLSLEKKYDERKLMALNIYALAAYYLHPR